MGLIKNFTGVMCCFTFLFVAPTAQAQFVKVNGTHFEVQGRPYFAMSTNFWQALTLASAGPEGNRALLLRELDRLQNIGINNIRLIIGSTGPDYEPWRVVPSMVSQPGVFNQNLFKGLDFLLVQMRRRGLRAVICLNNFWSWSGGMAQYLRWSGLGPIPYPPPEPHGSWDAFQTYAQEFYSNETALNLALSVAESIVKRTNSITAQKYVDDPTIMAWELANEPRGIQNQDAFNRWIITTSSKLKSWDPHHLVTTGSEGETPSPRSAGMNFTENHKSNSIDYTTIHIWAQNWGWYDPQSQETLQAAIVHMKQYLLNHEQKARALGKPLVLEEFGLARDNGSYSAESTTNQRDIYYRAVFDAIQNQNQQGSSLAGVGFWSWSGESRPVVNGGYWHPGQPVTGDPPHEPQGWYGVYDTDASTHRVIKEFSLKFSQQNKKH